MLQIKQNTKAYERVVYKKNDDENIQFVKHTSN